MTNPIVILSNQDICDYLHQCSNKKEMDWVHLAKLRLIDQEPSIPTMKDLLIRHFHGIKYIYRIIETEELLDKCLRLVILLVDNHIIFDRVSMYLNTMGYIIELTNNVTINIGSAWGPNDPYIYRNKNERFALPKNQQLQIKLIRELIES